LPSRRTGPKDWSPRKESKAVVLYNLGDRSPLDYGGYLVRKITTPEHTSYDAIYWEEPLEDGTYEVYTFAIENDVAEDLSWIDDSHWKAVADAVGITKHEILKVARSEDVRDRAWVYQDIGRHYGFENLDSSPQMYERSDMEEFLREIGFKP
jgi:hypothetical protein